MNLFTAQQYTGRENQTTATLLALLRHLSEDARDALLKRVVPAGLGPPSEVEVQRGAAGDVLDGWLRWGGRASVAIEAKVDAPLHAEQPERYAAWLGERTEEHRAVWVITRALEEARAAAGAAVRPPGVELVWMSWDEIAACCESLAGTDLDTFLAGQFAQHLRHTGIAAPRLAGLDRAALTRALDVLPQVKTLRDHLLRRFESLQWLPGEWDIQGRYAGWTEMSVRAERWIQLAKADTAGKQRWVSWWLEAWAPAAGARVVWPVGAERGLGVRLGVYLSGRATADAALDDLHRALGVRGEHAAPAAEWNPWVYDSGNYHEVWWRIPCDPFDLDSFEAGLKRAVTAQADRLSPLVKGGLTGPKE